MDSIRAPLLPLERLEPQGAQSPSAGISGGVQAFVSPVPELSTAPGNNRFDGDGGDVLALAAVYPLSGESPASITGDVSAVSGHLGTT